VVGTCRTASSAAIAFDDEAAVLDALSDATHILSSVPPLREGGDPVLGAMVQPSKPRLPMDRLSFFNRRLR
jgi:hypothetical protein